MNTGIDKKKIIILAAVNACIYSMIYMKGTFYNLMQDALGLSHQQLGMMWSVYGIVAVFSYLIGGWIADKYSANKLIIISLSGIIVMGGVLSSIPRYEILLIVFALFAVFSILTYYPISTKMVKTLGDSQTEGKVMGLYWGIINVLNLMIYAIGFILIKMYPKNYVLAYRRLIQIIIILSIITLLCFIKTLGKQNVVMEQDKVTLSDLKELVKYPQMWKISFLIFFSYIITCSVTYFTPFLTDVCGISEEFVLEMNLFKGYVLGIAIPIVAGIISDKFHSAARMISYAAFGLALIVGIIIQVPAEQHVVIIALIAIMDIMQQGVRTQVMVTLSEGNIPPKLMGCAIGFAAFIGYSPDAFWYTIGGNILDRYGNSGYVCLFWCIVASAIICAVLARSVYRCNRDKVE